MKYHLLHRFKASATFKKKFSDHFKDLHELKLLLNVDVNTPFGEIKLHSRLGVFVNLFYLALKRG